MGLTYCTCALNTTYIHVFAFKAKEGTGVDFSDLLTITSSSSHTVESQGQGMQIDPDSPREGPSTSR